LIDRARPRAAAKVRGSTEKGSPKIFSKFLKIFSKFSQTPPPHDGYKKTKNFLLISKMHLCKMRKTIFDPSYVLTRIFADERGQSKTTFLCFRFFNIKMKLLMGVRHSDSNMNSPYYTSASIHSMG
jgi:hypothetical protein